MLVVTVARKPLSESSVAANVLKHGTGAINIGATRIPALGSLDRWPANLFLQHSNGCRVDGPRETRTACVDGCVLGCPAVDLDKQCVEMGMHSAGSAMRPGHWNTEGGWGFIGGGGYGQARLGDSGGASRFFKQVGGDK